MTSPEITAAIAALEPFSRKSALYHSKNPDEWSIAGDGLSLGDLRRTASALADLKQWAERLKTHWLAPREATISISMAHIIEQYQKSTGEGVGTVAAPSATQETISETPEPADTTSPSEAGTAAPPVYRPTVTCPNCDGYGHLKSFKGHDCKCHICGGTGSVTASDASTDRRPGESQKGGDPNRPEQKARQGNIAQPASGHDAVARAREFATRLKEMAHKRRTATHPSYDTAAHFDTAASLLERLLADNEAKTAEAEHSASFAKAEADRRDAVEDELAATKADNEAKAREIERLTTLHENDQCALAEAEHRLTDTYQAFGVAELNAEIARLKSRPTSEEVEAGAQILEHMRDHHAEHYTLNIVEQDNLTLVAALLYRLAVQRAASPSEAGTAAPPVNTSASDHDVVARAIVRLPLWSQAFREEAEGLVTEIASALAAAEKRGEKKEREACAKIADSFADDTHLDGEIWIARRISDAILARSQPDERGG